MSYLEPDGHAQWTQGSVAAQADTQDFVGVYGRELTRYASTPDWALDGYHGSEPNLTQEVVQFGARHLALRDGLWMQPEPLLYLGLTTGDLGNPLGYTGLYAGGNPNVYVDRTGRNPIALAAAPVVVAGGLTVAETMAVGTVGTVAIVLWSDPQGSQQVVQAVVDTADFVVQSLRSGISSVATAVGAGLSTASKSLPELPGLDSTGKVHGDLPKVKDLGRYDADDLEVLSEDLGKSIEKRIEVTIKKGSDPGHGARQAAEQDLKKSVDKHLEDR